MKRLVIIIFAIFALLGATVISQLTVALTNADLIKTPASPNLLIPIIRFGVNAVGDAPPSWWWRQNGTCAANSKVSNVGTCNDASDGNSFIAIYGEGGVIDAREFGVTCDGSTDNSTALQFAVGVSNSFIALPTRSAGTCKYATTLTIGNGVSGTSVSTINNVHIGSQLTPQQWLAAFPQPDPTLEYSGSGDAIKFQGQMSGGGIQGVRLLCDNSAATGIHYISVVGLTSENFMIQGCKIPTQPDGIASVAPGTFNGDAYGGRWTNFNIEVPAVTGAIGINSSSAATWDVDFELWDHGNVTFDPLGSGTRTCIYAGFGDSNYFHHIHCLIVGSRTDTIRGVVLDYNTSCGIGGCNVFPNSYTFDDIDTGMSDNNGWSNNGSPSSATGPNFADNIPVNNGSLGGPIGIPHLWPDATPWQDYAGGSFTCTGSGSATGTPHVRYRQVRDTYQIYAEMVVTPSSCTGTLKIPLWATSPCLQVSGAPRWNMEGTNLTSVKMVQGIIDPSASPQQIEMFNYDGTVPVTGSSAQGISLSGFCQYSGGP